MYQYRFSLNNRKCHGQRARGKAGTAGHNPKPLMKGVIQMLKIILFPVRLVLSVFTGAMNFILGSRIINVLLSFASGIMLLVFVLVTWSAIFVNQDMSTVARILLPALTLLISYLLSPFSGVLKYLRLFVKRIEDLNQFLKSL